MLAKVKREGPFHFSLDYPEAGAPLFANVRTIAGWCWSDSGPVDEVRVRINGSDAGHARCGYPRLDAAAAGVPFHDALVAGFRIELDLDPASLPPGENTFEFLASRADEGASWVVRARHLGADAPLHVADVFIDIVGHCNLRCVMCPQGGMDGLKGERSAGVMEPALLDRILDHLGASHCLNGTVNLYNWGDPLLHPRLDAMLDISARHGQRVILSSNLSMPRGRVRRLLRGRTDLLIVSISGMTQETYARNHRGGRIESVLDNIRTVTSAPASVRQVLLKYLVFEHNRHEIEAARDFADEYGIQFGAYRGAVPGTDSDLVRLSDRRYAAAASMFVGTDPGAGIASRTCPQESNVIVDHHGNLDVCAMAWRHPFGASVLRTDLRRYLLDKMSNPTCRGCLSRGYAHYRHYEVIDPGLLEHTLAERPPAPSPHTSRGS